MSRPMTPTTELAEKLEELLKRATPGPWMPGHHTDDTTPCNCRSILSETCFGSVCTINESKTRAIEEGDNPPPEEAKANALLIVEMRNGLPALLDTLRKQAEELERCRTALEQNDELMWRAFKASFDARMAANHADDLVAEYTKSRRYAIVDERMKAAGVEPKQNGETK